MINTYSLDSIYNINVRLRIQQCANIYMIDKMNRRTRKEKKNGGVINQIVDDMISYLNESKTLAATYTNDEIGEIESFVTWLSVFSEECHHDRAARAMTYILSTRARTEILFESCYLDYDMGGSKSPTHVGPFANCRVCHLRSYMKRYFAGAIAKDPSLNSSGMYEMSDWLIMLISEAQIRGFKSLLAFMTFIRLTLYQDENGHFHIASEEEKKQAQNLVNMQHNFAMKFNIHMQLPTFPPYFLCLYG